MYIGCVNIAVAGAALVSVKLSLTRVYSAYVHTWTYSPLITYVILRRWWNVYRRPKALKTFPTLGVQ